MKTSKDWLMSSAGVEDWSNIDVYMVGRALMNAACAPVLMGHSTPASTLDYWPRDLTGNVWFDFVMDFVAWTSGRPDKRPGCDERIRREMAKGWDRRAVDGVNEILGLADKSTAEVVA